jgi:hypothetical protein
MSDELSRVRRAYEAGRLRGALPWLLAPALLSLVSCSCCVPRTELVVLAVTLAALLVSFAWRGGAVGAAAKAGLAAGLVACLAPIACPLPAMCVGAGLFTGLALGLVARTRASRRVEFIGVACLVAALTGAMGCLLVGLAGIAAMGVALAVGAVPFVLVPARSA